MAVLVGGDLEGETMLVVGGIVASRGDLRLDMVMAIGLLGDSPAISPASISAAAAGRDSWPGVRAFDSSSRG